MSIFIDVANSIRKKSTDIVDSSPIRSSRFALSKTESEDSQVATLDERVKSFISSNKLEN